jgi:transposase InsO family protein
MHKIRLSGGTFSPKKTEVCRAEAVILGHRCTFDGRYPEDRRIDKILNWPRPENLTQLRGFLGLCATVRVWIKDFSKIARPLSELQKKDQAYEWSEEREQAFQMLKEMVTSPPALKSIDYTCDRPIILSVDTSYIAVGMVLSQRDEQGKKRPLRYGSIMLKGAETKYSQPKLELFGLFRALTEWSFYIIGSKKLQVEVDAKYIKGMLAQPDLIPAAPMNRWIQGILLFDFELIHVPATKFKAPDGLSRRMPTEQEKLERGEEEYDDAWLDDIALLSMLEHHDIEEARIYALKKGAHQVTKRNRSLRNTDTETDQESRTADREERELRDIESALETRRTPLHLKTKKDRARFLQKVKQYFLKDGAMFKYNRQRMPRQVVFEKQRRVKIMIKAHEELGHRGEYSVWELINKRFFWPKLRKDVHNHIRSCDPCQLRTTKKMQIPPTISAPTVLFQKVYIDVMVMENCQGYRYIVAAKDDLTGVTEARAMIKNNSKTLARFFWEQIFCRYGAVGQVVTDNGPEVKKAFEQLVRRMGIPHVRITAYNKHANGVVERGHYILREALIRSCKKGKDGRPLDWPSHIATAVFADRVTINKVTGYSPYYLLHGVDPVLPFDLAEATFMVDGYRTGMSTEELLALRIRQ